MVALRRESLDTMVLYLLDRVYFPRWRCDLVVGTLTGEFPLLRGDIPSKLMGFPKRYNPGRCFYSGGIDERQWRGSGISA